MGVYFKNTVLVAELERGIRHIKVYRPTATRWWEKVRLEAVRTGDELPPSQGVDQLRRLREILHDEVLTRYGGAG